MSSNALNINTQTKPASILLVEDSEGDVFLIQKIFEKSQIKNNLTTVNDGIAALDLLQAQNQADIILLDVNLPKMSGKELLKEIKNHPTLRTSFVIFLTGSPAEMDVLKTNPLQPDGYIIKPLTLEKLGEALKTSPNFWFGIMALPSAHIRENL